MVWIVKETLNGNGNYVQVDDKNIITRPTFINPTTTNPHDEPSETHNYDGTPRARHGHVRRWIIAIDQSRTPNLFNSSHTSLMR